MKHSLKCPNCGFETKSVAGTGSEGVFLLKTFHCLDCGSLTDVKTGRTDKAISPDSLEFKRAYMKCGNFGSDNIVEWDPVERPCPKCKSKLIKE